MAHLTVLKPPPTGPLARLVDDYLCNRRAPGSQPEDDRQLRAGAAAGAAAVDRAAGHREHRQADEPGPEPPGGRSRCSIPAQTGVGQRRLRMPKVARPRVVPRLQPRPVWS
jgi:hypothetical protein